MFLLFSFCFHLQSPISFTFIFQILLDLVLQLLFYLVFVLLYFIIIYPVYSLKPKMWGKDEQFHYFPSRHKMKTRFNFFRLFFLGTLLILLNSCFNLSVFYNISQSACLWNSVANVFFWWPITWQEMRPGLFQKHAYALCDTVEVFSTFRESCIINL